MSKQHSSVAGTTRRRRWRSSALALGASFCVAAATAVAGIAVAAPGAGALAPRAASCTFSTGSQQGTGNFAAPLVLTGLSSSSKVSVTCSGLSDTDTYGLIQASPLAVVMQPFSLSILGSEADITNGLPTFAAPSGGVYTNSVTVGTSAAGTFSPGGSGSISYAPDPNAKCPPTQAQINAGLLTCVLTVADITASSATGALPSQADFVGEALLDFAGQPQPATPPAVNFNPPVVAPGHSATLTSAGASTSFWSAGWWGGGYPSGSLTPNNLNIPASNVLVNGAAAPSASVHVSPPVYCFYGGSSSTACKSGTGDTPGNGAVFGFGLGGSVPIPKSVTGSTATVSITAPNNWGPSFPGNGTNSQLTGTGTINITHLGYWEVASDGGLFSFGAANFYGSMGGKPLNQPIVDMAATPDGAGYWEVASDGGLFSFGDAKFYGSMGGKPLDKPIIGISATPDGKGYWEVATDGGLFSFGDAKFYGSMGGKPLDKPIVGIASTPDGKGYWEVASDGGLFSFGDAKFHGSMGGKPLNKPIVGMAATADGQGYWEVATDGGLFSFGDAKFYGSMGGRMLTKPIVTMIPTATSAGYWELASDGGIFSFGNALFLGSMGGQKLDKPIVGGSIVPVVLSTSMTLAETTTAGGYGAAGQQIPLKYLVTNTGGTNLANVTVTDPSNPVSCPSTTLAAGASETCTGTYTVTQHDVDSGSLTNSSSASGVASTVFGPVNASASATPLSLLANQATTTYVESTTWQPATFAKAGDQITFSYAVTNTGTTTIMNPTVTDTVTNPFNFATSVPAIPVTITCPSGTFGPGGTITCTGIYTVTQSDVDSGQQNFASGMPSTIFDSGAVATASTLGGAVLPSVTGAVVTVNGGGPSTTGISLAVQSSSTFTGPGQVITYNYTVTNTGDISILGGTLILNDMVGATPVTLSPVCSSFSNNLAPGQTWQCTGTYTTTAADVTAGEVTDAATAQTNDVVYASTQNGQDAITIPKT